MSKFKPTKPLSMYKDGTHSGNPRKDSRFIRGLVKNRIEMGGVLVNVYRFRGTFAQSKDPLGIQVDTHDSKKPPTDIGTFLGIQDPILMENRDREYDFDEIPRLHGAYQVSANELEYARFGLLVRNDVITMEFHARTVEQELGRRFIAGDVVEMPHLREVTIDGKIANRWYEVKTITWSPSGYDANYYRHVLGCVLVPLRHQQEFIDLFERKDQYGKTLAEQASTLEQNMAVTEAIQTIARTQVPITMQDTRIMYIDPNDHTVMRHWTDDGMPPNGLPVQQGQEFPPQAAEGDWFIRTDLVPNRLYRLENNRWRLRETDAKREWNDYGWLRQMRDFASDRSDADRSRNWEIRSIHDAATPREELSDPTGDENARRELGYKK